MQQPLHTSSIETARKRYGSIRSCVRDGTPVFVGAKQFIALRTDELPVLNENVNSEIGGSSFRSVLFLSHGPSGMLYRTGESVIIRQGNECTLLYITNFLSVTKDSDHNAFVRGTLYAEVDETIIISPYVSKKIVELTTVTVTIEVSSILRKVMVYPLHAYDDTDSKYLVIDHQRPFNEVHRAIDDLIVPVYPTTGDMVQICGEGDEIWYGHVLEVNKDTQFCQVHFYTEDPSCAGRYIRETRGRGAREDISWESLIQSVEGTWEGGRWRKN